jgi:HEAT repeat protein
VSALYATWRAEGSEGIRLHRSDDSGVSWQPLALPGSATPVAWAEDGDQQKIAVATRDGTVFQSSNLGETWMPVVDALPVTALIWDERGSLYLGTEGQGVHRLAEGGTLVGISAHRELASARIVDLAVVNGHLFAATPTMVYHTSDGGSTWTASASITEGVTAIEAIDSQTVYAGTATTGLYKSLDAGRTWMPAWDGLGLAAGQMVRVTALRADPSEPGLLYAAVDYIVGSTQVHASAAGLFVTADGASTWQPLAGPAFPEAQHASSLVLIPGQPLQARVVTQTGLQAYAPDVTRLLAALEHGDPRIRTSAARQLGLARPTEVWDELLAALDDPDMAVSLAASDALGRIDDPASVPGLLIAVEHPAEQVRLGAARALGLMGIEAAIKPLRAMLIGGQGQEAGLAAEALGRIGSPDAIDALLGALVDARPTTRWHAAMAALEGMGEPAVEPLVAMLDSQDPHARSNAAQALGWVGSPAAAHALARVLDQDTDPGVRGQAAWALGEIGESSGHALAASARRALEQAQLRDPAVEVQSAAQWALSRAPSRPLPEPAAEQGWAASLALALNQLQLARWLVLALSLVGAAWLMMGSELRLGAVPLGVRHRRR